ncbi:molecular chaperone DnaJ [Synechococcales cyanobacterium C]|uniref:Molecular chaperone DnaJ n=1 Tax=Petrachloros mirabilis ULC683 TaxID=2781853 RepID=A0A8K2A198_9CYAN|nr:CPP1-like family protein [Petrachloros mirabilis]NCJ08643.1 molecular chaperone DnaJ [Petrachloros mirabilis ULC683]
MIEHNPYKKLEVDENASFEEIQRARDRLIDGRNNDESYREEVEAAYDSILMDRLRKRQEGRLQVPEPIRFPERLAERSFKVSLPEISPPPSLGLQRLLDTPSFQEVTVSAAVFAGLSGLSVFANSEDLLAFLLALGVGFTVYWLNRKDQRLGRAVLLMLAALIVGGTLGTLLLNVPVLMGLGIQPQAIVTVAVFIAFWLVSSFLR